MSLNVCPWCQAPAVASEQCPKCGALYAKAAAIKSRGRAEKTPARRFAAPASDPESVLAALLEPSHAQQDPEWEYRLCLAAIPTALLLAMVLHAFPIGKFIQHTVFSMPLHELGHAMTSWFCGYFAIPVLWMTISFSETRDWLTPLLVSGSLGYLMWRARLAEQKAWFWLGAGLLLTQALTTLVISPKSAQALITFGGDAGALVLSSLLMGSFFFGKNSALYRGKLRWGFLVIGANAFIKTFSTWWAARTDVDAIPYGEVEGVGLSDSSRLIEWYGWTQNALVQRYVGLSIFCLLVLALVWWWGVQQAKQKLQKSRG